MASLPPGRSPFQAPLTRPKDEPLRVKRTIRTKSSLNGLLHAEQYIQEKHGPLGFNVERSPGEYLKHFYWKARKQLPLFPQHPPSPLIPYVSSRTTVELDIGCRHIVAIADDSDKKTSRTLAALSACYQLHQLKILHNPEKVALRSLPQKFTLSDGAIVTIDVAQSFLDYYCLRYMFPPPALDVASYPTGQWEVILSIDGRNLGIGKGENEEAACIASFLDATKHLVECDPELWQAYLQAAKVGADLGLCPQVHSQTSRQIEDGSDNIRH